MFRTAVVCLLLFAAACSDLTKVSAPPVPLSALGAQPEASADAVLTSSPTAVPLMRAVPRKTLALLHFPDIAGMIKRFQKTGLYKAMTSPALKELGLDPRMSMRMLSTQMASNPQAQRVLNALGGELVISLIDLQFKSDQPIPDVKLVAALSVRGAETEIEQMLKFVSAGAAQQPGVKVEMGSIAGTPFSRIVATKPFPIVVEYALHGDALIIGVGRETVIDAITRITSPEKPTVLDAPSFDAVMKRCGDPRDAFRFHMDLATAWERFGHHLPAEASRAVRAFGLDKVRSFGATIRFSGNDIVTSALIDSPGGKDFATRLLSAHAVDRGLLSRIPADASSFSLFALDGTRLLKQLREALSKDEREALEKGLSDARSEGIDIERDVLRVFGPRAALVQIPVAGRAVDPMELIWGELLGTSLVVEIQDPMRAGAVLSRLPDEISGVQRRDVRIEGTRVAAYDIKASDVPVDISICYAIRDGYFYLTPTQEGMRRLLRSRSPETAKRYEAALADVPTTAAMASYDTNRSGAGLMFQSMLMGMARSAGNTATPEQVLNLRLPELGTSVSYTIADSDGIFSKTTSPTGGLGSFGGLTGVAVMAAIAVPNLHKARLRANESAAISTMRGLHVAQETYRASTTRDSDRDGEGEFGFIADLLGRGRRGEGRVAGSRQLLALDFERKGREYVRLGYYFRIYLPADDGSPIGGHEHAGRLGQVDGDLAESAMVIVAWPVNSGRTGNAAFILDAAGALHQCEGGRYGGETVPPADILHSQRDNLASLPLRRGARTRDGFRWQKIR